MFAPKPHILVFLLATAGCKGDDTGGPEQLGGGPEKDARLVADVYSWECIAYGDDGPDGCGPKCYLEGNYKCDDQAYVEGGIAGAIDLDTGETVDLPPPAPEPSPKPSPPPSPKPSPPPSPKPSPPPSPKPSPPPSPPPKLEWGYITDVEEDPEIVALFDKAVKGQTITFPKGSESDYCVKKDPDCKHKNLPENKGIKGPPWGKHIAMRRARRAPAARSPSTTTAARRLARGATPR